MTPVSGVRSVDGDEGGFAAWWWSRGRRASFGEVGEGLGAAVGGDPVGEGAVDVGGVRRRGSWPSPRRGRRGWAGRCRGSGRRGGRRGRPSGWRGARRWWGRGCGAVGVVVVDPGLDIGGQLVAGLDVGGVDEGGLGEEVEQVPGARVRVPRAMMRAASMGMSPSSMAASTRGSSPRVLARVARRPASRRDVPEEAVSHPDIEETPVARRFSIEAKPRSSREKRASMRVRSRSNSRSVSARSSTGSLSRSRCSRSAMALWASLMSW